MTTHTRRYFSCPNGHQGLEHTRETDQPYGGDWSMTDVSGIVETGKDARGYPMYKCIRCSQPVKENEQ